MQNIDSNDRYFSFLKIALKTTHTHRESIKNTKNNNTRLGVFTLSQLNKEFQQPIEARVGKITVMMPQMTENLQYCIGCMKQW